jgi:hypothetical protein
MVGLAGYGAAPLSGIWLYNGIELVAMALVVWRVLTIRIQRLA